MNIDLYLADQWDRARSGNLDAYGAIHKQLFPKLYHYMQKMVDDEDLSQDLIQDLFLKLWEGRERIGPICNVRHYFFKSAKSMACNHFKIIKKQSVLDEIEEDNLVFSREDILVHEENRQAIASQISYALNSLSERRKEMIFLKYYQNLSYSEISKMTGINYQSVANHVYKGILQMREVMMNKERSNLIGSAMSTYINVDSAKYAHHYAG